MDAYVFAAELDEFPGVSRRIAVRGDQTLADLHEELRRSCEWWEDRLYAFWLDGEFWGSKEGEYTAPFEPGRARPGDRLRLRFRDEWRVRLTLAETAPIDETETYPVTLERCGKAPPQYAIPDEEELGAGD